jgi:hypothetical protein
MGFSAIPKDSNQVPLPVIYVHGVGWVVLQGSTLTDSDGGNVSTPANFNLVQLGSVAAQLDGAASNRLGISLYGKGNGAAGDTPILLDVPGRQLVGVLTTALFTTAQTLQGTGTSGDLDVSKLREVSIDITTSAKSGTNPTIQFFWNRKGADGIYYPLWQSAVLSATSNTISTSIGPGLAYNQSLANTGQLSWTVGGTSTPEWTFSPNVFGR